jgi:hypothetical protein
MHYTPYIALALATSKLLGGWEPTPKFVEAIAQVESGGDLKAIGDKGKARGPYQFQKAAWDDCRVLMKQSGGPVVSWSVGAHNEAISRQYVVCYCLTIAKRLEKDGVVVNNGSVYLCYTMGYNAARKIQFLVDYAPAVKQSSTNRVIALSK